MINSFQVYHRDVCELGFTDELNGKADAVFLDLPSPHVAVPHALKAIKNEGKLKNNLLIEWPLQSGKTLSYQIVQNRQLHDNGNLLTDNNCYSNANYHSFQ